MGGMDTTRRMVVLRAVVEDYIRSQEPVGSTALAREHGLNVSSATIRNDMAALEDEGYLVQPHTSAGRVPTEKGYRYFVDRLATVMPLSAAQRRGIEGFLSGSANLTDTLRRAARLLSSITGQVAVVASPSLAKSKLRRLELVPVSTSNILAVVIADTGSVAQHTLATDRMPTDEDLATLTAEINASCVGMTMARASFQIRALEADPRLKASMGLLDELGRALASMADEERASELYMSGAAHLAQQGAGEDLAPLLDALEEQVVLMKLMNAMSEQASPRSGVNVAIGSETHTPGLLHASVVASGYGRTESGETDGTDGSTRSDARADGSHDGESTEPHESVEPVAFVGSIGPTHMNYPATMAAVRAVARYLTAYVAERDPANPPSQ